MRLAQFVTGHTWGDITPDTLGKGLGGRETAAVKLALEWADQGHQVTLFGPVGRPFHYKAPDHADGEAHFVSSDMLPGMMDSFEWDGLLSWEETAVSALPHLRENVKVILCGMQVAHVPVSTEDSFYLVDAWVALSDWHRKFMRPQSPKLEAARIEVIPNCVDFSGGRFERTAWQTACARRAMRRADGEPPRFLYASSPDRGLHHVLRLWPQISSEWPGATLDICYGLDVFTQTVRWSHRAPAEVALDIQELLGQPGIINHGKVGQDVVAGFHLSSDILAYPCDPLSPTETGCITVLEACAGGNMPVITDADCLGEEFSPYAVVCPLPYDEDLYLEAIRSTLMMPSDIRGKMEVKMREFAEFRDWYEISSWWTQLFRDIAYEKAGPQEELVAVSD